MRNHVRQNRPASVEAEGGAVLWYCVGSFVLGFALFLAWGFYLNSHPEALARIQATKPEPRIPASSRDTTKVVSSGASSRARTLSQSGIFAVIDIETTGFSAARHHRVVEVAVVVLDDRGNHISEWETLVNPERDVTATEVHGLTAQMLSAAPTFGQVADDLRAVLAGRVPVAHNMQFDGPFLAAEFARLGYVVPLASDFGLCTKRMADRYLTAGNRRTLEVCCSDAGIVFNTEHRALSDARAAASLLSCYIARDDHFFSTWSDEISRAQTTSWQPAKQPIRPTANHRNSGSENQFKGRVPADSLRPGDAVVFTGESPYATREELQKQVVELGLRTTGSVSGRTRLVVAADIHSLSCKARGARERGIPIVTYAEYREMAEIFRRSAGSA